MATESYDYCSEDYNITREHCGGEAGGGATTAYNKFIAFAATKLKAVHALVTTAGTATAHKLDVYIGTTSVASLALGTSTANTVATVLVGSNVGSLALVSVKTGADVVGKAVVSYEYEYQNGASVTV